MKHARVRWAHAWTTCRDCASTVRPYRGGESKDGSVKFILFCCDCGRSRYIASLKVEKP